VLLQGTGDTSILADIGNPQTFLPHNWWSPIRGHHALHRTDTPLQHSMQTADSGAVSPALDGDCAYVPSGQSAAASALCDTITRVAT
jgi:hypothetical protein